MSRAYLPEVNVCESSRNLEDIDHTTTLVLSDDRLQQFKRVSADDPVFRCYAQPFSVAGQRASQMCQCLHAYYDFHDELTVQDQLVFKGQLLVVPTAMRKEMMAFAHATRCNGTEGCIRRARDSMYWPRISTEVKEYISK